MINVRNAETYLSEEIDLASLVKLLWRRRWWIVCAAMLGGLLALGLAKMMSPAYRASTVLAPADDDRSSAGALSSAVGQLGGLASLVGLNAGGGGSHTAEALAVLRSRYFLESFFAEEQLLPVLFADQWNAGANSWAVTGNEIPTFGDAFRLFSKKILKIVEDKKTSLVTISIDWRSPDQAAEWANKLVSRLNMEMRARAQKRADASVGFLKKELESTQDIGTREAINRLMEVEIKQRMLANTNQEYSFRVVEQASVPEIKDKVKPQTLLMVMAGFMLAVAFCIFGILVHQSISTKGTDVPNT